MWAVVMAGNVGIGHVRYPTAGSASAQEAQPFFVNSPLGIYLIHNGNLTNTAALRNGLEGDLSFFSRHLRTGSDSEVYFYCKIERPLSSFLQTSRHCLRALCALTVSKCIPVGCSCGCLMKWGHLHALMAIHMYVTTSPTRNLTANHLSRWSYPV